MLTRYCHRINQSLSESTAGKAFLLDAHRAGIFPDLGNASTTDQLSTLVAVVGVYCKVETNSAIELVEARS